MVWINVNTCCQENPSSRKGSQVSHLISWVAADAPFTKTRSLFVVHTGIKFQKKMVLKRLKKGLKLIFKNQ